MKKRIISSIMCLAMLLSLLPVTAFALETEDTRQEASNNSSQVPSGTEGGGTSNEEGEEGTDPVAPAQPSVVAAPVVDVLDKGNQDKYFEVTATPSAKDGYTEVALAGTIKPHWNGQKKTGAWVGFSVVAPKDATKVKYAFSDTKLDANSALSDSELEANVDGKGNQGIAFYANAADKTTAKTWAAVQWVTGADAKTEPVTAFYHMDLSNVTVEPIKLKEVHFEADKDDANEGANITDALPDTMWAVLDARGVEGYYMEVTYGEGTSKKVWPMFALENTDFSGVNGEKNHAASWAWSFHNSTQMPQATLQAGTYTVNLYTYTGEISANMIPATKTLVDTKTITLVSATLDAGEGTWTGGTAPTAVYAEQGGKVKIPETKPTRAGYTFAGWTIENEPVVLDKDGKLTLDGNVTLDAVWRSDKVEAGTSAPVVDSALPNEIKTALNDKNTAADASNVVNDLDVIEETEKIVATELTDEKVKTLLETANASTPNKYDSVKVVVYLQIEADADSYTAGTDATPASLKLDITPMYKLVAVDSDATSGDTTATKDINGTAKALETKSYAVPATITIAYPTGFPTTDLFAKHYKTANVVDQWIPATYTASPNAVITFDAANFSTYELTQDTRGITVKFEGQGSDVHFTPADIGALIKDPAPTQSGKVFSGWATSSNATSAQFVGNTLTEEVFDAMIVAANGQALNLYPVFTERSSGGGGGGGVSSNVTIDRPTNGKVSVTPTAPSKGATVTINLTPDTGYAVGTVTVTDKDGKTVELTKVSDTKYTFTMPDGKVTVKATFTKVDAPATGFTDVAADAYYADAVKWAVEKGITNGLTATTFGPNNSCTRGQMVTFLWRAAGSPAATATNSFTDVASGEYYYDAVLWAVEKGITNGTSATTFSPNATVNRGQTVTFLYRYAESPAATGETSFTDVAADAYYANAVKWAVAEEITNGTSSTTFSPASNCTRGQIVTFLYRQIAE